MNPKLVHCLFASMLLGGACAGGVLVAGGGLLLGLLAYSATGSVALVPIAVWAFRPDGRRERTPSALGPRMVPNLH